MIRPSLFRNYILLSIAITIAVLFLGFVSSNYVAHVQRERERLQQPPSNLLVFVARLLGDPEPAVSERAFARLKETYAGGPFVNFWLVNENGQVLRTTSTEPLSVRWEQVQVPQKIYESHIVVRDPHPVPRSNFWRMAPFFSPPGSPGGPRVEIVRLPGDPPRYLLSEFKPRISLSANNEALIFQAALLISIIAASLLTFGLISWHVRTKAQMAEEVMSRMQSGDLKARFPVQKHDEIGRIMMLFNRMGDEIERLVEKIKKTEQSRIFILQELAHDLRTPIASLKSMLETLIDSGGHVPPRLQEELMQMSLEEVDYFARLVEDLLLLAQVLEPQYQSPFQKISWADILQDEVAKMNLQQSALPTPKSIAVQIQDSVRSTRIVGDEGLLRRVFRNTLQNALAFAQSQVLVQVGSQDGQLRFSVLDDGPGFSQKVLENFGERRVSRYINSQEGGARLSVGLGSVIIKKVVEAHRGGVCVRNSSGPAGEIRGAEVLIKLPVA
jgi:signal transduction histidine kinase